MVGEVKRHQMMQNLFGDQSEEEDDEEEIESEHESNRHPTDYASDEGDAGMEPEVEGEAEVQGPGEVEVEMESDVDLHDADRVHGHSEGERDQSSQEVEVGGQREESEVKDFESDEKEDYHQGVATSRRDVIESASERSEENRYSENEDEEVYQTRSQRSPVEEEDEAHISHTAPELRDVFGDSDDEEPEYAVENQIDHDSNRSPIDEEGSFGKGLRQEDMLADEEGQYESEEENVVAKHKERPVGPPLQLEIPLRPPPACPEKMNMIKVSNIMGIDPKPFDPKTYVEEDEFETDESGSKKRIRLENNIVRWRNVKNPYGTVTRESNARFIRWSDGSLQLQIGNEVLDISVQDAQHDQAHLFLKHEKGILQSQGRLLQKMRFMPSSLTSKSHRLLTALVDSRHKKVYKVKNCVTDIDPEREKEQKERAESQTIRANELLNRKKEKVNRKYTQTVRRERQLSPGFLEDALEDDEPDYYESRHPAPRRRFDDDMEMEARAEKRIINAKKVNDISDPEAYERQHDEALLRTTDPYYERLIDEDPEDEDPEEVQAAEDTEAVDEDSNDEDPDEIQATADIEIIEEDTEQMTEVSTEQRMDMITEQMIDEGAEGDTEEQAEDDIEGDDSEMEAQAEEPVVDATGSSGIHLPPLPTERAPTPPPLPLSPADDGFEELTPEPQQTEIAPPANPVTPPHVPVEGMALFVHNWIVGRVSTEMAVAEARLAESRMELAVERAARIGRQGGGRFFTPRATRRAMSRIELRARMRVRALPTNGGGRISRVDAEEIFRRAMARVRALGRTDG